VAKGKKVPQVRAVKFTALILSPSEWKLEQAIVKAIHRSALKATGLHERFVLLPTLTSEGFFQTTFYSTGKTTEQELKELLLSISEVYEVPHLSSEKCVWFEPYDEEYTIPLDEWLEDRDYLGNCRASEGEEAYLSNLYKQENTICSDGSYFPEAYLYRDDDESPMVVFRDPMSLLELEDDMVVFRDPKDDTDDFRPAPMSAEHLAERLKEQQLGKKKRANAKAQLKHKHPPNGEHPTPFK
jgi:hypothetical protein